jgi:hypothetical protein
MAGTFSAARWTTVVVAPATVFFARSSRLPSFLPSLRAKLAARFPAVRLAGFLESFLAVLGTGFANLLVPEAFVDFLVAICVSP